MYYLCTEIRKIKCLTKIKGALSPLRKIYMKIFGFNRFNQWHYANKVEQYLSKISLDEVVDAINGNPDVFEITPSENFTISNDCNVRVYKKDDVYAIYINAIRIIITLRGEEKIFQISILGENEEWKLFEPESKKQSNIDITSSNTKTFTVYTFCDVKIPTGKMILDVKYNKGTWNEYVYYNVNKAIDYICSHSENNKFNNLYKRIK